MSKFNFYLNLIALISTMSFISMTFFFAFVFCFHWNQLQFASKLGGKQLLTLQWKGFHVQNQLNTITFYDTFYDAVSFFFLFFIFFSHFYYNFFFVFLFCNAVNDQSQLWILNMTQNNYRKREKNKKTNFYDIHNFLITYYS